MRRTFILTMYLHVRANKERKAMDSYHTYMVPIKII
jgi:hypothetical protein